ncbi:MAG: flagellar hook-length control protein FliK [Planctomycetota bacterium]|jgi:flagellar hook-length control protein FliK
MNTGLLTNTLIGSVGVHPALSKSATAKDAKQFAPDPFCSTSQTEEPPLASTDKLSLATAPEVTTTDNIPTGAQKTPVNESLQEFRNAVLKGKAAEEPPKAQASNKSKGQSQTFAVASQPNVVQSWLAQYPLVEHGEKGLAREMGPKAGHELAQLLTSLKTDEFPHATGLSAKSVEKELLVTIDKGQLGLKTVSPDSSRGQIGLKTVLPETYSGMLSTDTQPEEGKNTEKVQISNKTLIAPKDLINLESGKKSIPKVVTDDSKIVTDGEKLEMVAKPALSGGQKAPVLNHGFPTVQEKSAEHQLKVPDGPVKFVPIAEKPAGNKSDAVQQGQVPVLQNATKGDSGQILSESTAGNVKEQGGDASNDSILHKLNPVHFQISTNQTKDRGSMSTDSDSKSDFEQILLPNNAQIPLAEQTPVSGQAVKAAGDISPNGDYQSISEQIQGSINSSLRQGDQQITILLNPPELGKVYIKFQEQDDQITGLLEVDKVQTRYEIEQALPQIVRNLSDCGIQIKRLEVALTDQPEQELYKDQTLQDDWFGQQSGTEGDNPTHDAVGTGEWLTTDDSYSGVPELQEMFITDDSVNMLV